MNLFFAIIILCMLIFITVRLGKRNGAYDYIWIMCFFVASIMIVSLTCSKLMDEVQNNVKNPITIQAQIDSLSPISTKRRANSLFVLRLGRHGVKQTYYERYISYSYVVDGKKYVGLDTIESTKRSEIENINTNTIKIKYNAENPRNSVIDKSIYVVNNSDNIFNIITIIIFIGMGVIIIIGSTPIKEKKLSKNNHVTIDKKSNKNNTLLKILKIDIIDYEREKIFFEDKDKKIYYYETDFGEDFHVNEQYEMKLNRCNKEINKIEYDKNLIKATKIVNIEKTEFIKKE